MPTRPFETASERNGNRPRAQLERATRRAEAVRHPRDPAGERHVLAPARPRLAAKSLVSDARRARPRARGHGERAPLLAPRRPAHAAVRTRRAARERKEFLRATPPNLRRS